MANINRDYVVEIYCDFDSPYWKKFELVKRDKPMQFKKDDRNSANFFVLVHGFKAELKLTMGLLYPLELKRFEIYEPQLRGTQDDTYIFEVKLDESVLANPGTYKYEFYIENEDGAKIACDYDKFHVIDCL